MQLACVMIRFLILTLAVSLIIAAEAGAAKIKRFTDPQGTIHIDNLSPSDKEPSDNKIGLSPPSVPRLRRPAGPPERTVPEPGAVPRPHSHVTPPEPSPPPGPARPEQPAAPEPPPEE